MAMTKKEQAEREALLNEIARLKAWRLTEPVKRDVPPPLTSEAGSRLTKGWDYNAYSSCVYKACSSCISHGKGWERTLSQHPIALFSTRERAYAALRYAVEQECIARLAEIDKAATHHQEPNDGDDA
jgi:hypothetical protein